MPEEITTYPNVPMRTCTWPTKRVLLSHIGISPEIATPNETEGVLFDVYDFIATFHNGLVNIGHAEILINGHPTDIKFHHGTRSCIIDGLYLISLYKLNRILKNTVSVLWQWDEKVSKAAIQSETRRMEARKVRTAHHEDRKWWAEITAWPKACYVVCDPTDVTLPKLWGHMTPRPISDLDRKCAMAYDKFLEHVDCGGICDYDGSGEIMLDDAVMTGINVYPDEAIAVVPEAFILPLPVIHELFGDRMTVCWYNK